MNNLAKDISRRFWPYLVIKHTTGGACNFQSAADDLAELAASKAVRYKDALERIARTTGSDDPCREYVDIARAALREEENGDDDPTLPA